MHRNEARGHAGCAQSFGALLHGVGSEPRLGVRHHDREDRGGLHLAVVLDLFSRKIVGWATSKTVTQTLALEALRKAFVTRRPIPGLVHHSDRGGQYLSASYQDLLDEHGALCSMSRPGNCLDNAVAESFFLTLKTELIYQQHYRTREETSLATLEYIESFYSRTRLHSTLDYRSPKEYKKSVA